MNGCIYVHVNKANSKVYVGQSRNIKERWRSKYKQQPYFHNALNKHGWDGFDHFIVVDGVDNQAELDNLEKLWIIVLCSTNSSFGYNLVPGGFSGSSELGCMGGLAANRKEENRNRLKKARTFESSSLGGKMGGKANVDSGWSKELGFLQGNKNKESGHWDKVKILGQAFAKENGRKQGLRNIESGHLERLNQGNKNTENGHLTRLNHFQWHVKRGVKNPLCILCNK